MEPTTTALALVRRRDTHEGKTVVAPAGIKLFGQTITTLLPQPSTFKKEPENNDDEDLSTFNRRTTADRSTSNDTTTTTEEHKRPDKIIPCPRCSSMDTKFCYFNNYNVNQPRHFCKGCQRYWTAGGALRNVPIGAGRRKLKPVGGSGSGSDGGFVGGFVAERSGEFDKTVVEEYYWANHQRRIMVAGARSIGYCEDYQDDKRRKIESSTT